MSSTISTLSSERITEEKAFVNRYLDSISKRTVNYPSENYITPTESRPRKVGIVNIPLADSPELISIDEAPSVQIINVTVKSLKPTLTFPITASLTDSVLDLKTLVSKSSTGAPSVESQRLLLKGKALADNKLLKEYDITEGSTIHLILKSPPPPATTSTTMSGSGSPSLAPHSSSPGAITPPTSSSSPLSLNRPPLNPNSSSSMGHQRVPSLTITTDVDARPGSPGGTTSEQPLNLTDAPPVGPQAQISSASFHETISDPKFWQKLHALCLGEFQNEYDADNAWEGFLVSMKGRLSAGEAAKIRDVVGVRGMGGA